MLNPNATEAILTIRNGFIVRIVPAFRCGGMWPRYVSNLSLSSQLWWIIKDHAFAQLDWRIQTRHFQILKRGAHIFSYYKISTQVESLNFISDLPNTGHKVNCGRRHRWFLPSSQKASLFYRGMELPVIAGRFPLQKLIRVYWKMAIEKWCFRYSRQYSIDISK